DTTGGVIKAGQFGILASATAAGGTVTVNNTDQIQVKVNTGISADTTTGAISITNTGLINTNAFATAADFGIAPQSTTGKITIDNKGQLGNNAVGTTGLDKGGILAVSTGANTSGITVTNSAAIWMDTGSDAGIKATNAGTGTVTVNNTGAIDPANFGINTVGG